MKWEFEKIYFKGDDFFLDMLLEINNAKKSLYLEYYIWNQGVLANRILEALGKAVKRGVEVNLIVDGIGSFELSNEYIEKIKKLGINFSIYHPLPHLIDIGKRFSRRLFRINRRDHRKICLIDARIAFVGGMNVDDRHLVEVMGEEAWRDTGVQVRGEELGVFNESINGDIQRSKSLSLIRINNKIESRRLYNKEIVQKIVNARDRVWLTSPYFSPPRLLLMALVRIAKRGVDVRLLLPQRPDYFLARVFNGLFYPYLLTAGVKIYEYRTTVLHAKSRIIDDWLTVGTSNKNYRSFFYDLEIDIVLTGDDSKKKMMGQFLDDIKESNLVTAEYWRKRSLMYRIIEKLIWFFRRWV